MRMSKSGALTAHMSIRKVRLSIRAMTNSTTTLLFFTSQEIPFAVATEDPVGSTPYQSSNTHSTSKIEKMT